MPTNTRPKSCFCGIDVQSLTLGFVLLGIANVAMASPQDITEAEIALLPPYCRYTQTFPGESGRGENPLNPSPSAKRWVALMGKTFWDMHHYCWAHINWQRAMRSSTPKVTRLDYLNEVPKDCAYVIKSAPPDFILLPEIYTRKGEAELALSLPNDADRSFAKARALKPDYWPAYSRWAEFLIRSGNKAEAKRLLKVGLEHSPNAKVLREQYRLLGGNAFDIVPIVKKEAQENSAANTTAPIFVERNSPAKEGNDASAEANPKERQ